MAQNRTLKSIEPGRSARRSLAVLWSLLACAFLLVGLTGCPDKVPSPGPATPDQEKKVLPSPMVPESEPTDAAGEEPIGVMEPIEITAVRPVVDGPIISLETDIHDFGDIGPGTAHTAKFTFTNTGTKSLVIKDIGVCCGVARDGVEPGQRYAPGQSGTLEVTFQAGTVVGTVERILRLYTNDPMQEVVPLTIEARIVRRVAFEPSALKLFLKRDNAGARDIRLTSLDGRPFTITSFLATGNSITADFDPTVEATEFVLKPRADQEKLTEHIRGQIRIELTHPECSEVTILYDVLPEFTISPPQVMMFSLEPGKAVRRDVWLLANYEEDFEIESISSEKGLIEVIKQEKKTGPARDWLPAVENDPALTRYQLTIEFTPPEPDGNPSVRDDLLIKIAGGETIAIQCRGFYSDN